MNKFVELPLVEPLYQTYHYQGPTSATIANNPSIRNWLLNEAVNLTCKRKFLSGFTTPLVTIKDSSWVHNPCFEQYWLSLRFTKGYMHPIIRGMLDKGYYVSFTRVDDFYIPGKTWYKEHHFAHDGLICGYNQSDKTYCVYAYDKNWIYQKFWTPQKAFDKGCAAMMHLEEAPGISAIKPKLDQITFSPETACERIIEYLDSSIEKYPMDGDGDIFGIVVHAYIAEYVAKLHAGSIPYERMDRRVFRLIWEHKKAMLERMQAMEKTLNIENQYSEKYKTVVAESNYMRMLYASHHMKRRDSVLPIIRKKLFDLTEIEEMILTEFTSEVRKDLGV